MTTARSPPSPARHGGAGRRSTGAGAGSSGRDEDPSAGSVDSRSAEAAPEAAERGKDSNKRVVGRKQHLCVNTEGLPLSVKVSVASANDKAAAYELIDAAAARSPRLAKLWADGA